MSACGDRQRSSSWRRFWYATWKVASCFGPEGPSGSTAFSKVEALGRVSHELFQTEFAEGKAHVDARLRDVGQWEGELVHRKRNGERLVVASQQIVYCDSKVSPLRILEINADITEQKKAEQELRENRARFEGIID
jgi:hypothetical protein